MTLAPTSRHRGTIVVFDNARRLGWSEEHGGWRPTRVWPNAAEAHEILVQLERRRPLLVLLEAHCAIVPVLAEELAVASPMVTRLVKGPIGDVAHVHIPALDWLPANLRRRGLSFLTDSILRSAPVPWPLHSPVVLDTRDDAAPHVRFAHRLRTEVALDGHLDAIVDLAFQHTQVPAAG
jgi:hypothetical protein